VHGLPLKHLPAILVPVALAWVLAPQGAIASASAAVATVAAVAALCLVGGECWRVWAGPRVWLLALLAWAVVDAVIRPVAGWDAMRVLAAGLVAIGLVGVTAAPRTATWGRLAAVTAGTGAGTWLLAERMLHAGRPGGPFGNPNPAATLALVALALAPFLRAPAVGRAAVLAVTVGGIVASGSRAALAGVVAVAVAWGLTRRGVGWMRAVVAVLVIAGGLGLGVRLATDRDPLRYERVRIWAVALRVAAAEVPFGTGPTGFADAAVSHNFPRNGEFARFARLPDLAESDYLQLAATLGLPGVVLALGLVGSVVRRLPLTDARGWGAMAAVAVTSAVNSQFMLPGVTWTVALALGSALPRARPRHNASPRWAGVVAAVALAVAVGAVLTLPDWGVGRQPSRLVDRAQATVRDGPHDDGTLADAEALTWMACSSRPRYGRGWRVLGDIRLRRAVLRHDAELADAAADAFARARRVNPLDAWAALGEGQARRVLGDDRGAWRALNAAVQLEPNFVSAWLERAVLHLAEGEMGAARNALGRAEAALKRAPRTTFVSTYEYALAWADPGSLERLRSATGEAR
jgi:hypothetical protein